MNTVDATTTLKNAVSDWDLMKSATYSKFLHHLGALCIHLLGFSNYVR